MNLSQWVQLGTLVVLTITLAILIWYTRETYLLRKASYKQIEVGYMPILALDVRVREIEKRGFLEVCHRGYGPAFDFQDEPRLRRVCFTV